MDEIGLEWWRVTGCGVDCAFVGQPAAGVEDGAAGAFEVVELERVEGAVSEICGHLFG